MHSIVSFNVALVHFLLFHNENQSYLICMSDRKVTTSNAAYETHCKRVYEWISIFLNYLVLQQLKITAK